MHQPQHDQAYVTPRKPTSPLAIFGIIIGSCLLLAVIAVAVLAAFLFPVFSTSKVAAKKASCQSNAKQVAVGMMMYVQDYDERYPPTTTWQNDVMPYIKNALVYQCTERPYMPYGYAYNKLLDKLTMDKLTAPANTPMLYESTLGYLGAADKLESFVTPHNGLGTVAYADGHVKSVPTAPLASTGLPKGRK